MLTHSNSYVTRYRHITPDECPRDLRIVSNVTVSIDSAIRCDDAARHDLRVWPNQEGCLCRVGINGCNEWHPYSVKQLENIHEICFFSLVDIFIATSGNPFAIKRIDAVGKKFNPNLHDAIAELPSDQHAPGAVIAVAEHGYVIGERLLRAAKVAIAAQGATGPVDTSA